MTKQTKIRSEFPITVEHGGKSYSGKYWEESGMVYVRAYNPGGASRLKCTQIGRTPPASMARILLGEMVKSGQVEPDAPTKENH